MSELIVNPKYESLIPALPKHDFKNLALSIQEEGLFYPIQVDEHLNILDGHHRFKALSILKLDVKYKKKYFASEEDKLIFIIHANLKRRHLNTAQLITLGQQLHLIESQKGKSRQLQNLKHSKKSTLGSNDPNDKGRTNEKMSKSLGLSDSTYKRGKKVLESNDEKLKKKYLSGNIPTNTAFRQLQKNQKPKFPDSYEILHPPEIKSSLNVLYYNMNYEFKDKYPAKISEDFARDMIKIYSKEKDIVWDGFCGSGVVVRQAHLQKRRGFGTDINPLAIKLCKDHAKHLKLPSTYEIANVKTFQLSNFKTKANKLEKADLILSSPPFGLSITGDKNNYSNEDLDISNSKTFEIFLDEMRQVIQNYYDNLKPSGIMILDARDRTKEGRYWDLINYFRNISLDVGFKLQCRYMYFLMPWSHYTFSNTDTKTVVPMISSMDSIVMYKP